MGKLLPITISTLVLIILLIVPHRTTNDQSTAFIELLHKSSTNGGNMSQKNVDQKSLEDIETFFKILHGPNPIDGCQVVFTVGRDNQNRKIYTFKPGELSHIKGVLSFVSMSNHMYYEVCLQQSIPPNGKRGSAKSTASMPGLWLDIDVRGDNHKGNQYPESEEVALNFIRELPWKPTVLIHTGGGYQLLYLFIKPLVFRNEKERKKAAELSAKFQSYIRSEGEKHGWRIDNTQDLARLLRIPGSLNHKSDPPKRVTVVEYHEEIRYETSVFNDLPELEPESAKASSSASSAPSSEYEPWNGPPALIKPIYESCGWVRHCYDQARTLGYNDWFAIFSILKNCVDGEKLVQEWSKPHTEYSEQATLKLSEHAEGYRPRTCQSIRHDLVHEDLCSRCQYWNLIKSPITIGDPRPLVKSLTIAKNCSAHVMTDSSIVFREPCLKAFLVIQKKNPPAYEKIRAVLKKTTGIARLEKQMREYQKNHHEVFQKDIDRYEVVDNKLVFNKSTYDGVSDVTLCNFNSKIIEEIIRDDGLNKSISFRIQTTLENGEKLPIVEVPSGYFGNTNWFREKYGSRVIVYPDVNSKHLLAAIQTLSGTPPRCHIYPFTGWIKIKGQWAYLTNSGALGPKGLIEGVEVDLSEGGLQDYSLPVISEGDDKKALAKQSIKMFDLGPPEIIFPIYCGLFLSPLASVIDLDFSVYLFGTTGSGKSATVATAQAHFGHEFIGKRLPGSWTSTANALEKAAYLAKDTIFVIDDFKFTLNRNENEILNLLADRVLRGAGNRAGRSRMGKERRLEQAYSPRGLIISTGEDLPKGESLRSRILFLPLSPGDLNFTVLSELQEAALNASLSKYMSCYISWLANKMDKIKNIYNDRLIKLRGDLVTQVRAHSRTPDIIAKLIFGAQFYHWFITDNGIFGKKYANKFYSKCYKALIKIGNYQRSIIAEDDPAEQFITLIVASLRSGDCHIEDINGGVPKDPNRWGYTQAKNTLGPNQTPIYHAQGRRIGWTNGMDVYLDPELSRSVAHGLSVKMGSGIPISQKMLSKRLSEKGMLMSKQGTSNNARVTIQGKRTRVIHLNEASLK